MIRVDIYINKMIYYCATQMSALSSADFTRMEEVA